MHWTVLYYLRIVILENLKFDFANLDFCEPEKSAPDKVCVTSSFIVHQASK
jgi:hypothetical protein